MKEERIDNIGFGNLRLIQRPEDFCYGLDSVILADFACKRNEENRSKNREIKVTDLGAGNGAVSLILAHKCKSAKILAVEIQESAADLAKRNVELNHLEEQIEVICADILDLPRNLMGTMDMVVSNPPYVERSSGMTNKHAPKTIARRESSADLSDFIRIARNLLQDRGSLYMVHRPSRLVDLLAEGRKLDMEAKTLLPVAPSEGKAVNLVLIHFVKQGGKQMTTLPQLRVYKEDGSYTKEIEKIYERT